MAAQAIMVKREPQLKREGTLYILKKYSVANPSNKREIRDADRCWRSTSRPLSLQPVSNSASVDF
mgnify:CR=1 FL=1